MSLWLQHIWALFWNLLCKLAEQNSKRSPTHCSQSDTTNWSFFLKAEGSDFSLQTCQSQDKMNKQGIHSHPCTALLIGLYLFSPMYCPSFYLWMIRTYSHSCTAHLEKSGTTQAYSLYKKEVCHSLTQDRLLAVHGPWQACAYSQMGSRWPRIGSCKDEQFMDEYGDSSNSCQYPLINYLGLHCLQNSQTTYMT